MTMPDECNDVAEKLYEYIVDFDKEIYENEEHREDSLIQQATNMQTAFSFVTAAIFMVAPIVLEYRGNLSIEFFLVVFASISATLIGSLFCATKAQKRYQRNSFPMADLLQKKVESEYQCFITPAQRSKYLAKTYSQLHKSLASINEKRVKWINYSMILFFCSLGLCVFWFVVTIIKLL